MEMVKDLGNVELISKKGNVSNPKTGLFICPICESVVQKPTSTGLKAKTCGNNTCRTALLDYKPLIKKETSMRYQPYTRAINEAYNNLRQKHTNRFQSYTDFYNEVIEEYSALRETTGKVSITLTSTVFGLQPGNLTLGSTAVRGTLKDDDVKAYVLEMLNSNELNSVTLSYKTDLHHKTVYAKVKSIYPEKSPTTIKVQGIHKPVKTFILTREEFDLSLRYLIKSKGRNKSTNLYVVESLGYHKIGIAHNVASRITKLEASTPSDVVLIKEYSITNARDAERHLHKLFKDKNHKYEWFNLTAEDLVELDNELNRCLVGSKFKVPTVVTKQEFIPSTVTSNNVDVGNTYNTVPDEFRHKNIMDRKMYSQWRTVRSKVNLYPDFSEFVEEFEEKFLSLTKPTLHITDTVEFVEKCTYTSRDKAVEVFKDGSSVGNYKTAKAAAEAIGGTPGHITACCKGKRKSHKGFTFKYLTKV